MSNLLGVKISGQNLEGLTASFVKIFADWNTDIVDIEHSVIESQISLNLTVQLSEASQITPLQKALHSAASNYNVSLHLTNDAEFSPAQLDHNPDESFVLTVMARRMTAQQLNAVLEALAAAGLSVISIRMLTERMVVDRLNSAYVCLAMSLSGAPTDMVALRHNFLQIGDELNVDVSIQPRAIYRQSKGLACFDMDSTLIQAEVIDELAKAAGVGEQVAAITEEAMQGNLDFQASFRQRMALLKGLDESVLAQIAENLPVTEGVERLMRILKSKGYKTAILSGGFNYFGAYLQKKFDIDFVFANQLEIVDGKVTGEVKGDIVDGAKKAALLKQLAQQEGLELAQTVAVGDGANDLPMLATAGLGVAFRAKPIVKRQASHSIGAIGIDGVLYLLGYHDSPIEL